MTLFQQRLIIFQLSTYIKKILSIAMQCGIRNTHHLLLPRICFYLKNSSFPLLPFSITIPFKIIISKFFKLNSFTTFILPILIILGIKVIFLLSFFHLK